MPAPDTRQRILTAAALLFAERGFSETSLRTITSAAEANLAAVNYHFGSKKGLIQAVFAEYLSPFCQTLEKLLNDLEGQFESKKAMVAEIALENLLQLLFDALLDSLDNNEVAIQRFMRLLGLAYTQAQGHLRGFIVAEYGKTYQRFTQLLTQVAPQQNPVEFYWRLYFMLGATVFTLSSYPSISAILAEDFQESSSLPQVVSALVPAATGLFHS